MLTAAAIHGIDLSLMWATVDRAGAAGGRASKARQVCLAVPGAGRTAMLILSGPGGGDEAGERAERVACIEAACRHLGGPDCGRDVRLIQALPEPPEPWAVQAFAEAGFIKVGDLAYLRRPMWPPLVVSPPQWPVGITVRNVERLGRGDPDRERLVTALERSYEETLDCPELCGLRETQDILESHLATGVFDRGLWWLVLRDGDPHGCVLLSRCPDQGSIELVYLGLSPALRGQGLGPRLMEMAIARAGGAPGEHMTCAVDLRNVAAGRLYARLGFSEFGRRVAMVRPVGRP